ncbi:hypothetical protein [Burkholderia glumae]|uniref:hypothetical protein n=1 Tax=Burkholderia glumae TaxID=337 RepID=UPI0020B3AC2E|nr:hypothetical protein [Burkholderia glumae]
MNNTVRLKPLFHPGRLLVTPDALEKLRANQIPVISVMLRHVSGDWGIVSDDDRAQNDLSIAAGLRLLSIYPLPDGARVIVSTEWDRSSTTIGLIEQVVSRNEPRCTPALTRRLPGVADDQPSKRSTACRAGCRAGKAEHLPKGVPAARSGRRYAGTGRVQCTAGIRKASCLVHHGRSESSG